MAIVRFSRSEIDLSSVDWEAIDRTTDEEIDAQIAEDPDLSPIWTKQDFAQAKLVLPKVDANDVRGIRNRLHLSQEQFAKRFGFSVETIRNYEQGHRRPRGPASVLLRVIAGEPEAVERALAK